MEESQVYLDGAQRLRNVIEDKFGDTFNAYFIGSPDIIPNAAMPCIVFHKIAGKVSLGATMTDDLVEQVLIHILVNGKSGFGSPDNDDTVERQLFTLVEGRDPSTGNYLPTSIMYAIRQNLTLSSTVINHDEEMNYNITERPDQPSIQEAIITVTIYERIIVANRT
jgi:hypothetical protein